MFEGGDGRGPLLTTTTTIHMTVVRFQRHDADCDGVLLRCIASLSGGNNCAGYQSILGHASKCPLRSLAAPVPCVYAGKAVLMHAWAAYIAATEILFLTTALLPLESSQRPSEL